MLIKNHVYKIHCSYLVCFSLVISILVSYEYYMYLLNKNRNATLGLPSDSGLTIEYIFYSFHLFLFSQ